MLVFRRAATQEIEICDRTAELYPKNYYAWTHRQWLVNKLGSLAELLLQLEKTTKWTDRHVSDHCGFHHRQVILLQCVRLTPHASMCTAPLELSEAPPAPAAEAAADDSACEACGLWKQELAYLDELTSIYPGHESIWCHRRFVFATGLRLQWQHCMQAKHASAEVVRRLEAYARPELARAGAAAEDREVSGFEDHHR